MKMKTKTRKRKRKKQNNKTKTKTKRKNKMKQNETKTKTLIKLKLKHEKPEQNKNKELLWWDSNPKPTIRSGSSFCKNIVIKLNSGKFSMSLAYLQPAMGLACRVKLNKKLKTKNEK
jgi:hypothetical protein